MRHVETILACLVAIALYDAVGSWLRRQLKKRAQRPPPVPLPRTPQDVIEMLKKAGIPFEVTPIPPNLCPCPTCTARREQEKTHTRGESDGRTLH